MKKDQIFVLLFFILIASGSIWKALDSSGNLELKADGYRISIFKSAVVISHPSQPGVFNTIFPYDDRIILSDGSALRLGTSADWKGSFRPQLITSKNWLSYLKDSLLLLFKGELRLEVKNQERVKTAYQINSEKNQITIYRQIKGVKNRPIVGLERGLIFAPQNELWLDSQLLTNSENIIRRGPASLKIINQQLPEALELKIYPEDTLNINFQFNLITIKTVFSNPKEKIQDEQIVSVI